MKDPRVNSKLFPTNFKPNSRYVQLNWATRALTKSAGRRWWSGRHETASL